MSDDENLVFLRSKWGVVRYAWWRSWTAVALGGYELGWPGWLVNALGAIGALEGF